MGAFFGIVDLNNPINQHSADELASAMHQPFLSSPHVEKDTNGKFAFGHLCFEGSNTALPIWNTGKTLVLTGNFRLDYKDELRHKLGLADGNALPLTDGHLALMAYEKWGTECVHHLEGDWAMAVCDSRDGKIFFARDRIAGYSALYYTIQNNTIYFTSNIESLKAVGALTLRLDETELARTSFQLFGPTPGRTLLYNVFYLESGHTLSINSEGFSQPQRYWDLGNAPEIRYQNQQDYFDHLRELFTRSIQTRLDPTATTGIFLSGGLDSSAVASFAADLLAKENKTLHSFTSVPFYMDQIPPSMYPRTDEKSLVESLVARKKNIHPHFENSSGATVSGTLLDDRALNLATPYLTSTSYWISDILKKAKQQNITRILNGQMGNPVISWRGAFRFMDLFYKGQFISLLKELDAARRVQQISWYSIVNQNIVGMLKRELLSLRNRSRSLQKHPSVTASILHPDLLSKIDWNEIEEQIVFLYQYTRVPSSKFARQSLIRKLDSHIGMKWYSWATTNGVVVADPTADSRLISFSIGMPENLWLRDGISKYAYHKSFGDQVPDKVSHNQLTMQQSADLGERMEKDAGLQLVVNDLLSDNQLKHLIDQSQLTNSWTRFKSATNWAEKDKWANILISNISTCLIIRKNISLSHKTEIT